MVGPRAHTPTLDEVVNQVADLRPLSAVVARILQITEDDRFSAQELAQVIAADQALTAKMLRLSNSAYYGFPRRITTVRDAVVLLGFRAVRSATLASCVIEAMEGAEVLDYRDFWHFSVTVGMLAEVLARAGKAHRDESFTAGVMHNVGRLALDQQLPDALRESLAYAKAHDVSLHEAERQVIGFGDDELGGALTLHWNFPEPLIEATPAAPQLVQVPINLKGAYQVGSLEFVLNYEPSLLEVTGVAKGELAGDAIIESVVSTPGKVWIAMIAAGGVTGDGSVAVVSFRLLKGKSANSTLLLENVFSYNASTLLDLLSSSSPGLLVMNDGSYTPPVVTFE